MKIRLTTPFLLLSLFLISCSGSKEVAQNEKAQEPEIIKESDFGLAEDWHLRDADGDPFYGTSTHKAYAELLKNKPSKKTVIVAIIDSGTEITHKDLADNIWVNKDEIPNNGIDDDNNGYIDDIHGWNFIGGADGENVDKDNLELTRIYRNLLEEFEGNRLSADSTEKSGDYEYFLKIEEEFLQAEQSATNGFNQFNEVYTAIGNALSFLSVTSMDSLSGEILTITPNDGAQRAQAKQILGYFYGQGITQTDLQDAFDYYYTSANYHYNLDFNPRYIVGDNYDDLSNRFYGNNDVAGPSNSHGTHVAGIIGAVRNNNLGVDGIADAVELMILRAVPNGDEHDKDIANSVRYAVDNGANIINMSFGKGYSPQKEYVDQAFRYADSLGVLVIHSAGNSGANVDTTDSFPKKQFLNGRSAQNYITVGASSWDADSSLAAVFSNFGSLNVDLFAPGVDIYSSDTNNSYIAQSGTSMAGPVVAGVAALVWSRYPELSASDLKSILLQSTTQVNNVVYSPGTGEEVPFSMLSVTGGIVNTYEALKLAEQFVREAN